MINLCNRTEYSFRKAYGPLDKVLDANDSQFAGICDINGTWGHVAFEKACKKRGIKPIFGVELACVDDAKTKEKQGVKWVKIIALDNRGLKRLYELVTEATHEDNFYYFPRVDESILNKEGEGKIVILTQEPLCVTSVPLYLELNPATQPHAISWAKKEGIKPIATSDNYYPRPEQKNAYEICIGSNAQDKATPIHILNEWEWSLAVAADDEFKNEAVKWSRDVADKADVQLPRAHLVEPPVDQTLREMCEEAAPKRNIDLTNQVYRDRLDRELMLIAEKEYEDYFFLIADLCKFAKQHMLVGPARGSSCGSLVCYLLEITEVDPIPYSLLFERFIDINRKDLPDIDIDFPDLKRDMIFEYLRTTYGTENVAQLGTVSRFKAKSTIDQVSMELQIPAWEVQDLKGAIIERSGGDSRAAFCIMDTFRDLEVGRRTLAKYPELGIAAELEAHARHSGRHAAGIVVTSQPVSWYCSVDQQTGAAMVDKKDAEELNLLKIDALGLRTLTVLEDCLEQIGWTVNDLLKHPKDDMAAFEIINAGKFTGIFQFEGYALQSLCHQMKVDSFEDVVSITALARPGPLNSGMATEWLRRRNGEKSTTYDHPMLEPILNTSYGVVIYQENIMQVAREVGKMSWEDVSSLRKAMSKSLGKEFFDQYKVKFLSGAASNGFETEKATEFWDKINMFGSWAFNRCLHEDTLVRVAIPNKYLPKEITIKTLFEKYGEVNNDYYRKHHKPALVSLFPDGRCYPQNLITIHKNGPKECFEYFFDNGASIKCTKDHKFLINGLWQPISGAKAGDSFCIGEYEELKNANGRGKGHSKGRRYKEAKCGFWEGEGNVSWENGRTPEKEKFAEYMAAKACEDCNQIHQRMEVHHNDMNGGVDAPDDLAWLCPSCHKKRHYGAGRRKVWEKGFITSEIKLVEIKPAGMAETYDIEMPKHHNFMLANGLITHNSHAVAYGMVSYWCMVLKAKAPLEYAAACLRHSKSDDQCIKLLRELHHEGYDYCAFDREKSKANWSVQDGKLIGGLMGVKGIGAKTAQDIELRRKAGKELTKGQLKKLENVETPYDMIFECQERWGHIFENPAEHGIASKLTLLKDITQDSDGTFVFIAKLTEKNLRDHNELVNLQKRGGVEMKGQSLFLNFTVEDDTDSLICTIDRFKYDKYGQPIVESGKIGDWYIFKGRNRRGFRKIYIERWKKLT